jgi:hypothetical protein
VKQRFATLLTKYEKVLRTSSLAWTVLITVLITTWIDVSRLHEFLNSDFIVPVLTSLVKWTPFYWEENRLGMLIPLLAAPIRPPLANLIFQAWLGTFAGLFASFLLLRYVMGKRSAWLIAGLLVNLMALCMLPLWTQYDWLANQCYGVSLTLGLAAFVLLEKPGIFRWAIAIVLMLLAHWVNIGLFTLLAPLAVLHYFAEKQRSDLTRLLPCLSLGALGGWLAMRASPYGGTTRFGLILVAEWPHSWENFLRAGHMLVPPNPYQLLWVIVPAVATVILLFALNIPEATRYFRLAAVLAAVGLLNWLFMGTLVWVRANAYFPRYAYPAMLFATAGLAILEAPLLEMAAGSKRELIILAALLVATVGYRYGTPSIERTRQGLDQRFGQLTEEILTTHAAVIAGNYWTVWPAVFHANLVLYERGEKEHVYGLTERSADTIQLWAEIPRDQLCVAGAVDDTKTGKYLDRADIRSPRIEHLNRVDIFTTGDVSSCRRSSKTESPLQYIHRHF